LKSATSHDAILVTGGAGFIGSHTVDALLRYGSKVWVLDDLSAGSLTNLKKWRNAPRLKFIKGDVRNSSVVAKAAKKADAIIHLAAIVSPRVSTLKPELATSVNVIGTLNLLQAAVSSGVQRFVYASSAAVYGDSERVRVPENAPLQPISPYGVSKLAAEKYCDVYYKTHGLETVSLRYFNVYGQRQRADNPYSGVIAIFAKKLISNSPTIINGNGLQSRDFVHVSDIVSANLLALTTKGPTGQSYNIGTGRATSIKRLHTILAHLAGRKAEARSRPARPGDIGKSCADISKARRLLGYKPKTDLETGLRNLLSCITNP
jgi:nucleoside-diphosphate-sugar epimerase